MGEAEDWHAAATTEVRSHLVARGAIDDAIAETWQPTLIAFGGPFEGVAWKPANSSGGVVAMSAIIDGEVDVEPYLIEQFGFHDDRLCAHQRPMHTDDCYWSARALVYDPPTRHHIESVLTAIASLAMASAGWRRS